MSHTIKLRSVILAADEDHTYTTVFETIQQSPYKKQKISYVNEAAYVFRNNRAINPFGFNLKFQQNEEFSKINLTANYEITVSDKYAAEIRMFAGTFIGGNNKGAYRFRASGITGYQDYMYDGEFFREGANIRERLFLEFTEDDGGLKVWTPLGQSDTWMAGLNIKSPKFFK